MTDDTESAGAIVVTPCECGRGPRFRLIAFERIHRGSKHPREVASVRDRACEPSAELLREVMFPGIAPHERTRSAPIPEAGVHVTRGADFFHRVLGHERKSSAVL